MNITFLDRLLYYRLVTIGGSVGRVRLIVVVANRYNTIGGVIGILPAITPGYGAAGKARKMDGVREMALFTIGGTNRGYQEKIFQGEGG